MGSLLERVLQPGQLRTFFHPIIDLHNDAPVVFGLECLTRGPKGTNVEHADVLFDYARRKGREDLLDIASVRNAILQAVPLSPTLKLFVNVHASTLGKSQAFVDGLQDICFETGIPFSQLVLEIVEHSPYWDPSEFVRSTRRLSDLGVQLAVDDLGVAYSSFKMILDAEPQFLKVDMYITRGCDRDQTRSAMLASFRYLAEKCNALLISEGIETQGELDTTLSHGIQLLQGYLFTRPLPGDGISEFLKTFPNSAIALNATPHLTQA